MPCLLYTPNQVCSVDLFWNTHKGFLSVPTPIVIFRADDKFLDFVVVLPVKRTSTSGSLCPASICLSFCLAGSHTFCSHMLHCFAGNTCILWNAAILVLIKLFLNLSVFTFSKKYVHPDPGDTKSQLPEVHTWRDSVGIRHEGLSQPSISTLLSSCKVFCNPNCLKYIPGVTVFESGTKDFPNPRSAHCSPLARYHVIPTV